MYINKNIDVNTYCASELGTDKYYPAYLVSGRDDVSITLHKQNISRNLNRNCGIRQRLSLQNRI